jgi:hypothetical protein
MKLSRSNGILTPYLIRQIIYKSGNIYAFKGQHVNGELF